jgi:transcriptional regulator with XRE-family HTH domain
MASRNPLSFTFVVRLNLVKRINAWCGRQPDLPNTPGSHPWKVKGTIMAKSATNGTAKKKSKQRSSGPAEIEMGRRIRVRRVEMGISQAELGDKLGVSFQQVQKYEKGVNRVGAARIAEIAQALDVPVTFFYGSGSKNETEVESLIFADPSYSLRLLRAYVAISNVALRRNFVVLMEGVAGIDID